MHAPLQTVFAIVAATGNPSEGAAREAYVRGLRRLGKADATLIGALDSGRFADYAPTQAGKLEPALMALDKLVPADKSALLAALTVTIMHDNKVSVGEAEVLRAICAMLHCPLPPLGRAGSATGSGAD